MPGNFNTVIDDRTLDRLASPEWGSQEPIRGLDQISCAGAGFAPGVGGGRRRVDGRLLSDHAPVEVTIE
jgi:hypothetical protein